MASTRVLPFVRGIDFSHNDFKVISDDQFDNYHYENDIYIYTGGQLSQRNHENERLKMAKTQ